MGPGSTHRPKDVVVTPPHRDVPLFFVRGLNTAHHYPLHDLASHVSQIGIWLSQQLIPTTFQRLLVRPKP